jgi:hypothetical protein
VTVSKTPRLPFSSTIAIGVASIPASVGSTICSSGNARPIPSPSTSGSPSCAAAITGTVEFTPPASMQARCVGVFPTYFASVCTATEIWSADGSFSTITVGAPIIATGSTQASSGRSPTATISTGPCSFSACSASSRPMCGSPPPPVPSTAAPRASAPRSSARSFIATTPFRIPGPSQSPAPPPVPQGRTLGARL